MARPRITDEGRIKQGRGQGTGTDYIPWIQVRDFGSKGRVTRDRGWITGRVHHLRYNPMEVWDRGEDDKNGPHGACYW